MEPAGDSPACPRAHQPSIQILTVWTPFCCRTKKVEILRADPARSIPTLVLWDQTVPIRGEAWSDEAHETPDQPCLIQG